MRTGLVAIAMNSAVAFAGPQCTTVDATAWQHQGALHNSSLLANMDPDDQARSVHAARPSTDSAEPTRTTER